METHLLIGGKRILRNPFRVTSPFYPDAYVRVANAALMDIASAIGCARRADRGSPAERLTKLNRAAELFSYTLQDLEHAVRMTGMPIRVIQELFDEIPIWLRETARILQARFPELADAPSLRAETLTDFGPGLIRLLAPMEGFCYAMTPGNDPRGSALVAANLCALGIPFVLRASPRDGIVAKVIEALIGGGFDPNFCSLLTFNLRDDQAAAKHFKLVDACSAIWTFGPDEHVDSSLRYRAGSARAWVDLDGVALEAVDEAAVQALITARGYQVEAGQQDHFAGKVVLRHNTGNCAAIADCKQGSLQSPAGRDFLYRSIAFPLGCTATKALMLVNSQPEDIFQLADALASLKVGDPLDPQTQVGFIHPQTLDYLEKQAARLRALTEQVQFSGGERLSEFQAAPLLVAAAAVEPEPLLGPFLADEIPAYVLAVQACAGVEEAIEQVNLYTDRLPRLAVAFYNLPLTRMGHLLHQVRSHAIMVDRPTSQVIPVLHEGNDYALRLTQSRLLVK